jgi:hypothetical protein
LSFNITNICILPSVYLWVSYNSHISDFPPVHSELFHVSSGGRQRFLRGTRNSLKVIHRYMNVNSHSMQFITSTGNSKQVYGTFVDLWANQKLSTAGERGEFPILTSITMKGAISCDAALCSNTRNSMLLRRFVLLLFHARRVSESCDEHEGGGKLGCSSCCVLLVGLHFYHEDGAVCVSETSVHFHQTITRYIPVYSTYCTNES